MDSSQIDNIDIKHNSKELIDLYFKIELLYFLKGLLYEHCTSKGVM